jgi:LAGLIDADG endonuclease
MDGEGSDKAPGAVNQQERLESYIAGFVDGEGCFHVALQRNPCTRVGWQLVPEFRISQDAARAKVLDLARELLGCGLLRENHRGSSDHTHVLVVRRRKDLLERVIPFFERNPLLSCKQDEFITFAAIVRAMARGDHLVMEGFERLAAVALQMNGGGRYRRLHRAQSPESSETICQAPSQTCEGEDMVRSAWRHAEPGRNVLAPDRAGRW